MKAIQSEYYGDNTRWFIGKAKCTLLDPLGLGRIRVRVFGLHTSDTNEIEDRDLPWAPISLATNIPSFPGAYQGYGINDGDTVFGIFLDGKHSQSPLVLGVIPHIGDIQSLASIIPNDITAGNDINITPTKNTKDTTYTNDSKFAVDGPSGEILPNIPPIEGQGINTRVTVDISSTQKTEYIKTAFDYFNAELAALGSKYPAEQSAALVGNFLAESNMNPTIKSSGKEDSWGIAQWNRATAAGNRYGILESFAQEKGLDPLSLEAQLQYVMYELKGNVNIATGQGRITVDTLMKKSNIKDATRHVLDIYENPNVVINFYRTSNPSKKVQNEYNNELNKRIDFAIDVYNAYTKG